MKTNLKTAGACFLACTSTVLAIPATLTATFNALAPDNSVQSGYSEGGLTFTSPTPFAVASRSWAATLFGAGAPTYPGSALSVNNSGWVGITANGSLMAGASFTYGFDWNFYAIEHGLMDVAVEWRATLGGALVDSGGEYFNRERRSHGGGNLTTTAASPFDELLIRSTAVLYQGIFTNGLYERGAVLGFGDLNHLAFDNVTVTTASAQEPPQQFARFASAPAVASVPDLPWSLPMAAISFLLLAYIARRFPVRT